MSFQNLVPEFGMSTIDTAIEAAIENDAAADASAYRDIDEPRLIPAGTPACFGESASVSIVLYGG
jgi:hypothetical protein